MEQGLNILLTIGALIGASVGLYKIFAWIRYKYHTVNKAKNPAAIVSAAAIAGGRPSLAQRKDATEAEALNLHSELDRYLDEIAKQAEEEDLRKQLVSVALTKKRIRTTSALKADMQERADAAGPETTFIYLKEAELNQMKKAKALREAEAVIDPK
jgi:hypothetical protein